MEFSGVMTDKSKFKALDKFFLKKFRNLLTNYSLLCIICTDTNSIHTNSIKSDLRRKNATHQQKKRKYKT